MNTMDPDADKTIAAKEAELWTFNNTFAFPLSPNRIAYLTLSYPMPEDDFDLMLNTIKLWKSKLCQTK